MIENTLRGPRNWQAFDENENNVYNKLPFAVQLFNEREELANKVKK